MEPSIETVRWAKQGVSLGGLLCVVSGSVAAALAVETSREDKSNFMQPTLGISRTGMPLNRRPAEVARIQLVISGFSVLASNLLP